MSVRSARYNLLSLRNPKGLTVIPEELDAWVFLDNAQIRSSQQQRAIIQLVRELKHAQLWSKMKAIYPFVGGTATTHKFNLKDPRDADAAYRLSFVGGWTHNSDGITGNGTNTYSDTFLKPTTNLTANDNNFSIYIRNNPTAGFVYDIVSWKVGTAAMSIAARFTAFGLTDRFLGDMYFPTNRVNAADTSSIGYYVLSRTSSTVLKAFKNGTQLGSTVTSTATLFNNLTERTWIGQRDDLAASYTARNYAFATIGDGLTDSDATALYNIVQRFQTSLGRQV